MKTFSHFILILSLLVQSSCTNLFSEAGREVASDNPANSLGNDPLPGMSRRKADRENFYTDLVDGYSLKHERCETTEEMKTSDPRRAQAIEIQTKTLETVKERIKGIITTTKGSLALDKTAEFSAKLDAIISKNGRYYEESRNGMSSPERAIWAYMEMPPTVLNAKWSPFRRATFGTNSIPFSSLYGFDPTRERITHRHVFLAYPKVLQYLEERRMGKEADKKMMSDLVRIVSVAIATPVFGAVTVTLTGASLTFSTIAGNVATTFQEAVTNFVRDKMVTQAHAVTTGWLDPSGKLSDEALGARIEEIYRMIDAKDAKESTNMLFAIYRDIANSASALGLTVESSGREGGLNSADSASFKLAAQQVDTETKDLIRSFGFRVRGLHKSCVRRLASDLEVVQFKTATRVLDADIAFARLMKTKAECMVSEYLMIMTELRWIANIANETIASCRELMRAPQHASEPKGN